MSEDIEDAKDSNAPAAPAGPAQAQEDTPPREPSGDEVARMIAERLGETEPQPLTQIKRLVWELGRTQALALCEETLQIEERGGLLVPDGSRRRTVGGIFFHLARTKGVKKKRPWLKAMMQPRPQQKVQPGPKPAQQGASSQAAPQHQPAPVSAIPPTPAFTWQDRIAVLAEIGTEKGTANVKITVIGRPGKIVDKGTCVVTVVQSTKIPALPKAMPTPSPAATTYTVYIASKQWKKVAEAITSDPEDVLILEGFPQLDSKTNSIAVFVSNASTKKLQQTQKQAQKGEAPA